MHKKIIVSFIFLFFNFSSISLAWDNGKIHPEITRKAIELLKPSPTQYSEFLTYGEYDANRPCGSIIEGAVKEDHAADTYVPWLGIGWDETVWGSSICDIKISAWLNHAWQPKNTGTTGSGWLGTDYIDFKNAKYYAETEIWPLLETAFRTNLNKSEGLFLAGRLTHLLADMTSPAHVHGDIHSSGDDVEVYAELFAAMNILGMDLEPASPATDGLPATNDLPDMTTDNLENFFSNLAIRTHNMTSYYGGDLVKSEAPDVQPDSELKRMFPSLHYDTGGVFGNDSYVINEVGNFWIGLGFNEVEIPGDGHDWWEESFDARYYYLENTDGADDGSTSNAKNNLGPAPAVFKKADNIFQLVKPSDDLDSVLEINVSEKKLVDIYTDNLLPLATKWIAGFLNYIYWNYSRDMDQDTLPDWWEELYFDDLDPIATDDPDNDGVENYKEWFIKTDPTIPTNDFAAACVMAGVIENVETGKKATRITWNVVDGNGISYKIYRSTDGGEKVLVADNVSGDSYVEERVNVLDTYYVVVVSNVNGEDRDGPFTTAIQKDYPTTAFTVVSLATINTPTPGGHAQLYGVIADPDTGFWLEQGTIIVYGTTGTYKGTINDGRVRMVVTAPASDESWTVVLQRTDGSTEQLPLLDMNVTEGDTVKNLRTSTGVGTATISFAMPSGYSTAKIEVGVVGGSMTTVQESTSTSYTADQFSPGDLIEFRITPKGTITNDDGDLIPITGDTAVIYERVGWGGQLLSDTHIDWPQKTSVNDPEPLSAKYPHVICSSITVPVGLALTISPRSWLQFKSNVSLLVQGSLTGDGIISQDRIYFSSNKDNSNSGDWGHVIFYDGSEGFIQHAVFTHGDTVSTIYVNGGHVNLSFCTFTTPSETAITVQNASICNILSCTIGNMSDWGIKNTSTGDVNFSSNKIYNCNSGGIYTVGNSSFSDNLLLDNGTYNAIYYSGFITGDVTWENNIRFNQVTIAADAKLTILPGITCYGNSSSSYIEVSGQLIAEGTAESPIAFTSAQVTPQAGDWDYLQALDGSTVSIKYATIEYAGGNVFNSTRAAIMANGGNIALDHVNINNIYNPYSGGVSVSRGVWIQNSPTVLISNCNFSDIEDWGIVDSPTSVATITNNTFNNCLNGSITTTNSGTLISNNTFNNNGNNDAVYFSGEISGDVIWSQNIRFHQVTVNSGAKLTILPGITCYGNSSSSYIEVSGQLIAEGTAESPIAFTSAQVTPQAGDWDYLQALDGSTVSIKYATIEYAGGNVFNSTRAAIMANGGNIALDHVNINNIYNPYSGGVSVSRGVWIQNSPTVLISNCNFSDIEDWGIVDSPTSVATITNNTFNNCLNGSITTTNSGTLISNNTFNNNGNNDAVYFSGEISGDVIWSQNIRFRQVTVNPGAKLTILPGITCYGNSSSSYIKVSGQLIAEGTSESPIAFTSAQVTPQAGDWDYLQALDGSTVSIKYATIEYAGGNVYNSTRAAIMANGGNVELDHVNITNINNSYSGGGSVSYGVWMQNSSNISITNCRFSNIESWAIYSSGTNTVDMKYSIIHDTNLAIYSSGALVDARMVNWGTTSGPYHATENATGTGGEVRGNILFIPWLNYNSSYCDFETGDWEIFGWGSYGDDIWTVSNESPLSGNYSAKAPAISDNQSSSLQLVADCGEGYISFRYGIDSEKMAISLSFILMEY